YKPLQVDQVIELVEKMEKGGLVLLTDDDPTTCETVIDFLKLEGYKIAAAKTGEEAVEAAKRREFDVILIDIKLPIMNGLETFRALKKTDPEVKAIMITGYPQEVGDLADQALQEDAYTVFNKPLDPDELLKVVNLIMEGKSKEDVNSEVNAF
ncbi:response regulator, partial [Candidatus Bathyarchaeota archaeon]|nr:response regulator [Candidatus Bathyarchaeota archaeon]